MPLLVLSGCFNGGGSDSDDKADHTLPMYQLCNTAPLPTDEPKADWNHLSSRLFSVFSDQHSAQDIITVPDTNIVIAGKFAYSIFSKDLEDEVIEVWMDDCSGSYKNLGEATTDNRGRIAFNVRDKLDLGEYGLYLRVKGDDSHTLATLRVAAPGTQIMLFDIDGTLTTGDSELFRDLLDDLYLPIAEGDFVPDDRAAGRDLTLVRAQQSYINVYLTGRPYWVTQRTRDWLADLGFAAGNLHLTDKNADSLPTNASVGSFKANYIKSLQSLGLVVHAVYGNATSDIFAYEQAAIDKARTFIVGKHGGEQGTINLGEDFQGHIDQAGAEPDAQQPFQVLQ